MGAHPLREPQDGLYGDRSGGATDPAGDLRWIARRATEVSPGEIARRHAAEKGSRAARHRRGRVT